MMTRPLGWLKMDAKPNIDTKIIINALITAEGNASFAAHLLGTERWFLYKMCRKYKIRIRDYAN